MAIVFDFLNEGLATLVMALLAGLDKVGKAQVKCSPHLFELVRHGVAIGFGILAKFFRPFGDLYGVFVVPHEEKDFISQHPLKASLGIRPDFFKRGSDVRATVGIVDGGGHKKALGHRNLPEKNTV